MAGKSLVASSRTKLNGQCWGSPFKRFKEAEFQDRHEKGIRYCCDEKFFVGHCCKNKQLQILLVEEEDDDN